MPSELAIVLREGRGAEDVEELTNDWRDFVEATHHFLPLSVLERLEPIVRDGHLPAPSALAARCCNGLKVSIRGCSLTLTNKTRAPLFFTSSAASIPSDAPEATRWPPISFTAHELGCDA